MPGTNASSDEMIAIADAFTHVDHGAIEIISDHLKNEEELQWIEHMARTTGRPLTTLVTPETGEEIWKLAERLESEGINIRPQAGARLASILMTLEGTVNPMRQFPSYSTITVSYTHLRAHETVLDLVCRLLLEKKKKT